MKFKENYLKVLQIMKIEGNLVINQIITIFKILKTISIPMTSYAIIIINKIQKNKIIIILKIKMKFIKRKQNLYMEEKAQKVCRILITINLIKNKNLNTIIQSQENRAMKYNLIIKKKENRSQKKTIKRSKRMRLKRILRIQLIKIFMMRNLIVKLMKVILIIQVLNQSNKKKVKVHNQRVKLMNKTQKILAKEIRRNKIFLKQNFQKNLHKIHNKFLLTNHKSSQVMKIITQSIQSKVNLNNHNNRRQNLHQVNLVRMA